MPQLTSEHQRRQRRAKLAGNWAVGSKATGRVQSRVDQRRGRRQFASGSLYALLRGMTVGDLRRPCPRWPKSSLGGHELAGHRRGVIADRQQERTGQASFRSHCVFRWGTREESYTMHWFDSSGIEQDAPANRSWEGQVGESEYRLRIETPDGNQWTAFLDALYRRAG